MKYKQKFTAVRFSHLTSYRGIGAIIRDENDMLMTVTDTRYWTDKHGDITSELIHCIPRITTKIGKELRMPPKGKELENGDIEGHYLPAVIFPNYAVCTKCGLLHYNPWEKKDLLSSENLSCEHCNAQLEQVTWCAISIQGNLDNVPWHYICHQQCNHNCHVDYSSNYLMLTTSKSGKKIIQCQTCGCSRQYDNIYGNTAIGVINKQQPWIYLKAADIGLNDVEILEINSPGVYLPKRDRALVIPPDSRINKGSVVYRLFKLNLYKKIESIKMPFRRRGEIQTIADEFRCTVDEIEDALLQINNGYEPCIVDKIKTDGDFLRSEYKAFRIPIDNVQDYEDFVTQHKTIQWHNLEDKYTGELLSIVKLVDKLIIAKRLRVIEWLKGFCRVEDGPNLVPPDIVGKSDWIPAIELFGEGLFFTLDEKVISRWEKIPSIRARADEIVTRHEKSKITLFQDVNVTPRFLLLHTIAHLLIRELEITAGYPAASLKERIYCSESSKMSGILIYTAVPDIVGTLGGIIESAEPDSFISLLDGVFKRAQWCSLDPVCTEHEGQGPGWLNRAACHACTLIPEPSCDFNNVFLDRVFIKGSEEIGIPNLLDFIAKENSF